MVMLKKVRIFLEMIKFEHTIFALPFAFMGALLEWLFINASQRSLNGDGSSWRCSELEARQWRSIG